MSAESTHRIIVSPLAMSDLGDIDAIIGPRNPHNASRFVRKIRDQIDALARLPERFAEAPEARFFREPLRHVTVWPYRIVYRVKPDTVEVVTIRHGARRPMKLPVGEAARSDYPPATP